MEVIGRITINHAQFGTLPSSRGDVTVSTAACRLQKAAKLARSRGPNPDPRAARENAIANERGVQKKAATSYSHRSNAAGSTKNAWKPETGRCGVCGVQLLRTERSNYCNRLKTSPEQISTNRSTVTNC